MQKVVRIDTRAQREIGSFPALVQAKIKASLLLLARDGRLEVPFAKKLDRQLFEIRIKHAGQWRVLYAYIEEEYIIILSAFQKKTQKTPSLILETTKQRLRGYENEK